MEKTLKWLQHSISPIFLALLVASFMLWYIAKLNYTYTTEQTMTVELGDQKFDVQCVVEGLGTNLFKYQYYMDKHLRLSPDKVKYQLVDLEARKDEPRVASLSPDKTWVELDQQMIREAISVQCSDIKILSVETPIIEKTKAFDIPQKTTKKQKK